MCEKSKDLKLCTCENLNQKIRKNKEVKYVWTLQKYLEESHPGINGMCALPIEELNEELSDRYVVEKLNEKNIFDFDYVPKERDCLRIETVERKTKKEKECLFDNFMEFIYTKNQWEIGWCYPFSELMEYVAKGVVELKESDKEQ